MFESQNNPENIKLLKAINFYYSKAKRIKNLILIVSIIIPILFMTLRYLKNIEQIKFENDLLLISIAIIWIFISLFLDIWANKIIVVASKIQEIFDTSIFNLETNDILFIEEINEEIIYEGETKFNGQISNLKDWYGNKYLDAPHYLKVLIAQRINIIWANELKKKFLIFLYIIFILIVILPLFIALSKELKINDTILFLAIPMIPLYVLVLRSILNIKKQVKTNESVDKKILKDCNNINNDNIEIRCRQYQDYVFKENRINSVLIPDWFFKLSRENMNKKIIETNTNLLKKFSKEIINK